MKKNFLRFMLLIGIFCASHTTYAHEYRILALRVDFPYEDPDNDTTSGRGVFDLREYTTDMIAQKDYVHPWDIPPHNKRYFEHHLDALNNYWQAVSDGAVTIAYDVMPKEKNTAYRMSNKFYKYGNGRSKEQMYEKLVLLFKEALETCYAQESGAVDFTRYDTFMIIHAGIGSETSGQLNDIPSAYISEEDIITYLGGPLSIGGCVFRHGIIVPEMTSPYGNAGLNGIMAQMFGFRLGLPSFSNNKDGLPAAGGWCLMDTGAMAWGYNTLGFIPTHPCIWSKIELGFVSPVTVTADTTLDIAATHLNQGIPRGIKIPLTEDEYLLIENRYVYAPRDSLPRSIEFSDSDSSGVWLKADHYDAFIPGSGILIWHVNDRIIREKRSSNTINDDSFRRGLDLLEADGRQDIGAPLGFGDPRGDYTNGHEDDAFKASGKHVLSPTTNPSSGSMWGGDSGVTVTVKSDPGEVMSVSISFNNNMNYSPLHIVGHGVITSDDLDGDTLDELIVSDGDSARIISMDGTSCGAFEALSHPAVLHSAGLQSPFLCSVTGTRFEVRCLTADGFEIITSFDPESQTGPTQFEPIISVTAVSDTKVILCPVLLYNASGAVQSSALMTLTLDGNMFAPIIPFHDTGRILQLAVMNDFYALVTSKNILYYGHIQDTNFNKHTLLHDTVTSILLTDLDRDNLPEMILAGMRELTFIKTSGKIDHVRLPQEMVGCSIAVDVDSDGYPEVIQCTKQALYAFRTSGIRSDGFPFHLPPGDTKECIVSSPVACDISGDSKPEILLATSNGRILSYDYNGLQSNGFPMTITANIGGSLCLFSTPNNEFACAGLSQDGCLITRSIGPDKYDTRNVWSMWKGNSALTSAFLSSRIQVPPKQTAPFDAYCYPNPVTGSSGTFRIVPSGPTDCSVTLYTVNGVKVYEGYLGEHDIHPGIPNELRMDTRSLASGLYIAHIKTRQKTILYKVGVLK